MTFIHSILESNAVIAVDGVEVIDLPVNPLSDVLIHISPLNETSTITAFRLFRLLIGALVDVDITHRGVSVTSGSGVDLAVMAMLFHRLAIWQSNAVDLDNDRRSIVLPILFGRRPYDPRECFPASRKGELQMSLDWDIAAAGYDGLRRSIETIELPDATPESVQRVTTLSQTFAATGNNDIDLPIGNVIRAILCFGTTPFNGPSPAPTLGALSVLKDNAQVGYMSTDFEVVRAVLGLTGRPFPPDFRHIHAVNAAGVGEEDTREPEIEASIDASYCLLDFDPMMDDQHVLETAGAGRVNVRVNADAANAARFLPVERMPASAFTAGR